MPRSPSPPKKTIHSNQLLSRFQSERDARTRLISVLARQSERHRELLPVWIEQWNALRVVVARAEHDLQKRSSVVDQLAMEREDSERSHGLQYDALVRGLAREQEKALSSAQAKKQEYEKALEAERLTTEVLRDEERKNEALRTTLDRTMAKLNSVRSEMAQHQAKFQNGATSGVLQAQSPELMQATKMAQCNAKVQNGTTSGGVQVQAPELMQAISRVEVLVKEKELVSAETVETKALISQAQDELNQQRDHAMKLEEFVKKVATAGSGYRLDVATRKEAAEILASAARIHGIAASGNEARNPRSKSPTLRPRSPFAGRRCAAYENPGWQTGQRTF